MVDGKQRSVAVTGAAGFLGRELIRRMESDARYRHVIAIDRRAPQGLERARFHSIDLVRSDAGTELSLLLADAHVDTVVHCALRSSPSHDEAAAHALDVVGTSHVLDALARARVPKLVVPSTTLVYGAHADNPNFLVETSELRGQPGARFVSDKIEMERLVARFAVEDPARVVTVLRAALTLGRGTAGFVARFLARPIVPRLLGHDPLVQLLHEDDLVDAAALALDEDHAGVFNLASEGALPFSTVLALLGRVAMPLPRALARPLAGALWAASVADAPPELVDLLRYLCVADIDKARTGLGFAPRHDLRSTLADFLGLDAAAA